MTKNAFYFDLDFSNIDFLVKLSDQYKEIELKELEEFQDLLEYSFNLDADFLIIDGNTPTNSLVSAKSIFGNALQNTKLLIMTSEYFAKENFNPSHVKDIFKSITFLPSNLSLVEKSEILHKFLYTDTINLAPREEAYVPLSIVYLNNLIQSPCDIYLKISDKKFIKIINRDDDFKVKEIIEKYAKKNIKEIYVSHVDINLFQENFLQQTFNPKKIEASTDKASYRLEITETVLNISKDFGISATVLNGVNETFKDIHKEFSSNIKIKKFLEDIKSIEGTIIGNHSYLITIFISVIGKNFPWFNKDIKKNLFTAAILHDLDINGMSLENYEFKSLEEIKKLPSKERDIVLNHANHLARRLALIDAIPSDVINIISKHHEGSGSTSYPQGLHAAQLSPVNCLFNVAHQFSIELFNVNFDFQQIDQVLMNLREHYPASGFKNFIDALEREIK